MLPRLAESGLELLRRTFDIRPGEMRRVSLMGANIFLIISTLMIIKPVINALFLSYVGVKSLPSLFLLVATVAMGVSVLYARALNRLSLHKIILRTYQISIPAMILTGVLLHLGLAGKWVIYVFYIGEVIFALLTTSQFWILANLVFNPLEAKRLFSLVGAGAIAGGVMGGYLTSVFAPILSNENLLFMAAALLAGGFFVNRTIWRDYITPEQISSSQKEKGQLQGHPLKVIRNSRHLTLLALIVGIGIVIAKLVEYQYSALASAAIPDADNLAAFLGFWFSTFNIVSLIIQVFITRRVVGIYGVGKSLFVLPIALFGGATLLLILPVLWVGILLKLFDVSLKQSINKAAVELLILPIPLATKSQAKTFIDVFVDTAATGVGGILLLFLINVLDLPLRAVSLLIIALIGIWIWFAMEIRKEYIRSFQENLKTSSEDEDAKRPKTSLSDVSVLEGMRGVLKTGSDRQLLYVLGKIEESKETRLIPDTLPLLDHESAAVRVAALKCLYFHPQHDILPRFTPLLQDIDAEVRAHAFTAILSHSRRDRVNVIHQYLQDADPMINGAALVGLAKESRNNAEMQRLFQIEELVMDKIHYLGLLKDEDTRRLYKIMIIRAIGHGRIRHHYSMLDRFLQDEELTVRKEVLLAMGDAEESSFIPVLSEHLLAKETRDAAKQALVLYGPSLLPHLEAFASLSIYPSELLRLLPSLAERIQSPQSVDYLFAMIRHPDVGVRLAALQSLHTLKGNYPDLHISEKETIKLIIHEAHLYKDTLGHLYTQKRLEENDDLPAQEARQSLTYLLERRLDGTLERIFQLLGLRYSPGQINPVYEGIKGKNPDIRFNAVEFLDNILEPDLKKILIPIVESALIDPTSDAAINRLNLKAPSEAECFDHLLKGRDEKIKMAVIRVMNESGDAAHRPRFESLLNSPNQKIKKAAQEGLDLLF